MRSGADARTLQLAPQTERVMPARGFGLADQLRRSAGGGR
jgi:hypothetical protein